DDAYRGLGPRALEEHADALKHSVELGLVVCTARRLGNASLDVVPVDSLTFHRNASGELGEVGPDCEPPAVELPVREVDDRGVATVVLLQEHGVAPAGLAVGPGRRVEERVPDVGPRGEEPVRR